MMENLLILVCGLVVLTILFEALFYTEEQQS